MKKFIANMNRILQAKVFGVPKFGMLAAAVLLIIIAIVVVRQNNRVAETATVAPSMQLDAYTVAYRDVPETISAEGVVEAVRQSTLAAQIAGQIVELRVKVGDSVKAGQVLARIDPRAAEQAVSGSRSQVAEAQAGLTNALRNFERNKELFAQKFISKAALDQAEVEYKAAQARVAALQANAGQASTAKTFTTITAPYDGVIAATPVQVGDMATPGRALVTIFDPASMRVLATLSQSSLRDIKLTVPAQIEVPALKRNLTSKQITLVPLADSRTHTAELRLELGGAQGLSPGQFVRAFFVTGTARKLVIPESAVLRRSEVTAAYVLYPNGLSQLRQIRVGETSVDANAERFVEVLTGLGEGDRIALNPVKAGLVSSSAQPAEQTGK